MEKEPNRNAREILERYLRDECTPEETLLVERWYNLSANQDQKVDADIAYQHLTELWGDLNPEPARKSVFRIKKIAAFAACVIALLGLGIYLAKQHTANLSADNTVLAQHVDTNTTNRAILTLSDGSVIQLDSLAIGQRVTQQGVTLTKEKDGTVTYRSEGNNQALAGDKFNTISTPHGQQYTVILPDESRVWLNAASTIRFPVSFDRHERAVELNGEGFFEVTSDPNKPFVVSSKNQQIIVKGTKFNINAYSGDRQMTTTLLEGAVLVRLGQPGSEIHQQVLLHPNEQLIASGESFEKLLVDAQHFSSWKDGKFIYDNSPLENVMRQLSRWYNVDIVYLDAIDGVSFTGSLSKADEIGDVLRKISLTQSVHFEMKGRRVMVTR